MTVSTTERAGTIERLLMAELGIVRADPSDTNVGECLRYARQLDDEDLEPRGAREAARQLNVRLLALQSAYWRIPTLPALLSEAMHDRAAAVHARLSQGPPTRPRRISRAARERAYLDGYRQHAQLTEPDAAEALLDESGMLLDAGQQGLPT